MFFLYNEHYFQQIQGIVYRFSTKNAKKDVAKHTTMVLLWQQIAQHEPKFYFVVAWGRTHFMFKTHVTDSCICR